MMSLFLFFGLLCILFLLSQAMTRQMSFVLHKVLKNQTISMYLIAIIFFPGVLIHELSHFFTAIFLGVHAGHVEFFPKIIDGRLKLGSVQIQNTDPLRKTLIGVAPIIGGILVLLLGVYLYKIYFSNSTLALILLGIFYFQVSNTMFSSKKDMEGTGAFFIVVALFIFVLWIFKIPVFLYLTDSGVDALLQSLLDRGSIYLGVAAGMDILLLLVLMGLSKLR